MLPNFVRYPYVDLGGLGFAHLNSALLAEKSVYCSKHLIKIVPIHVALKRPPLLPLPIVD